MTTHRPECDGRAHGFAAPCNTYGARPYDAERRVWGTAIFPTSGGPAFAHIVGYDRANVVNAAIEIVAHEREYPVYAMTVSEYHLGEFLAPGETYDYEELERDGVTIV